MIIENLGKVETVKLTDVEPLKKITKGSGVYGKMCPSVRKTWGFHKGR